MTTDTAPVNDAAPPSYRAASRLSQVGSALSPRRISGVYLWAAIIVYFSLTVSVFWSTLTLRTVASEQAVTAIVSLGLMVALAAGVFDLSIGGVMGLANIIVAQFLAKGMGTPEAILLTMAICSLVGVLNGVLVVYARIDPFIATLGVGSILSAVIVVVSGNENVQGVPESFTNLSTNTALGIPLPVYYVIALALVLWYVLGFTPMGRRLYATGGGREVARLAGVRTNMYIIGAFVTSATVASAAGILVVSEVGTGPTEVGASYLLPAFAAGFLGATQFRPGRFNVWGTVLAVYLLATGVKGLVLAGADIWVPDMFNGVALIIAVGFAGFQKRARTERVDEPSDPDPVPEAAPPAA